MSERSNSPASTWGVPVDLSSVQEPTAPTRLAVSTLCDESRERELDIQFERQVGFYRAVIRLRSEGKLAAYRPASDPETMTPDEQLEEMKAWAEQVEALMTQAEKDWASGVREKCDSISAQLKVEIDRKLSEERMDILRTLMFDDEDDKDKAEESISAFKKWLSENAPSWREVEKSICLSILCTLRMQKLTRKHIVERLHNSTKEDEGGEMNT